MHFQALCRRCLIVFSRKTLFITITPVGNSFRKVSSSYQLEDNLRILIDSTSFNSVQWKNLIFRLRNCVEEVEYFSKKGMNLLNVPFTSKLNSCHSKLHIVDDYVSPMEYQHDQLEIIKTITMSIEELYHSVSESEKKREYKNAIILLVDTNFPSENVLLYLADIFSLNGNLKGLSLILSLYKKGDPDQFRKHCSLNHYKAQALWVSGNFKRALDMFSDVYSSHDRIKTTVINMIKRLIIHAVEKEGIAIITLVQDFVSEFTEKNDDMSLMGTLWYALLLSEWYRDWECASDLLLNSSGLQKSVAWMMPHITANLLHHHRVEAFYRLMEMLLKCSMEKSFGIMLRSLFDYYYYMGNIKRCSAVVTCSRDLHVPLSKDQEYNYSNLVNTNRNRASKYCPDPVMSKGESFMLKF